MGQVDHRSNMSGILEVKRLEVSNLSKLRTTKSRLITAIDQRKFIDRGSIAIAILDIGRMEVRLPKSRTMKSQLDHSH
jgi:hypothetical protein